eukprot:1915285-Rhodomonas_salina.2
MIPVSSSLSSPPSSSSCPSSNPSSQTSSSPHFSRCTRPSLPPSVISLDSRLRSFSLSRRSFSSQHVSSLSITSHRGILSSCVHKHRRWSTKQTILRSLEISSPVHT